jgi:hypothetical protein
MPSDRSGRQPLLISLVLLMLTPLAHAQSVKVEVDGISDDRIGSGAAAWPDEFHATPQLRIDLKLTGVSADKAAAARAIVKQATDDRGTNLAKDMKVPDFRDRNVNSGMLDLSLDSPSRDAKSVNIKGSIELFMPSKDPAATVTIPKAFAKLDKPLTSEALTAAGIKLKLLSPAAYAEDMKKHKLTDADIEKIRAEGKAHGASDKEIESVIGLAKAFDELGGQPLAEGSVILAGSYSAFDKIQSVDILGADKKPLNVTSKETTKHGESAVMILHPESLPAGASLRFTLLTSKSKVSVPFELKNVELP